MNEKTETTTIETVHGSIEYDVVECVYCSNEVTPDSAASIEVGNVDTYPMCHTCIQAIFHDDVDATISPSELERVKSDPIGRGKEYVDAALLFIITLIAMTQIVEWLFMVFA
jgi:hypothetical protein